MYELHYYGIASNVGMDKLERLGKKADSLDMKDFLFGNSLYMANYIKPILLHTNDVEATLLGDAQRDEGPQSKVEDNEDKDRNKEDRDREDVTKRKKRTLISIGLNFLNLMTLEEIMNWIAQTYRAMICRMNMMIRTNVCQKLYFLWRKCTFKSSSQG